MKELVTSLGLLILRLGVGGYMLTHGWGKLRTAFAGGFNTFPDPIGLGPGTSLVLAVSAEFVCAVLVMLGLATRLAAIPVIIAMAVAAFVVHGNDPWTMEQAFKLFAEKETQFPASKEPALLYLVPFLALVFTGPGRFSLDELIVRRWRRPRT